MKNKSNGDDVREAAAVMLGDLVGQVSRLAERLRADDPLPPAVVAALLVDGDKIRSKLAKLAARLPSGG